MKRYRLPFLPVSLLFLVRGMANNMNDTLPAAVKRIMSMSDVQTSLVQFSFYGAYFCFALPAALFIRRLWGIRRYRYGVVAQFFYVGVQTCVWSFNIRLAMHELGLAEKSASTMFLLSMLGAGGGGHPALVVDRVPDEGVIPIKIRRKDSF